MTGIGLVPVPRDLIELTRTMYLTAAGHWEPGSPLEDRVPSKHDRRMPDGTCTTCALVEILDRWSEQPSAEQWVTKSDFDKCADLGEGIWGIWRNARALTVIGLLGWVMFILAAVTS